MLGPSGARLASLICLEGVREWREIRSPLDGTSVIGAVPVCTADDIVAACKRARAAQPSWARTSLQERCAIASKFRDLVIDNADALLDLVHWENGKSRINAYEELLDTALTAGYYSVASACHLASKRRAGAIPVLTSTHESYRPKGVIGIISPWNYPLTLAVSDAIPALIAGNTCVLKPDSDTPFTALAAVQLLYEAGVPQDAFPVVTGPGATLGTPLIDNVDYLMFTGSTATGRKVAAQASERLIGCSMELGGKNPMLVLSDADMDHTIEGAVQACYSTTGQLCVSIERIYVAESRYDEFCERFAARTAALKLGAGFGWADADYGPLISEAHLAKVSAHVDDALAKGAKLLAGGHARPDLGPTFFEPTLLTGVTEEMTLCRSETFGPVVSVYSVASDAEAIARANDTEYGLNACIWSSNVAHARRVAAELTAGTININEGYAAAWASHDAPMGGTGISGLGRRHGRDGIVKYCEPQTVAVQRLLLIAPPKWASRENYAKVMSLAGRLLHRIPGIVSL
jgi:succinate-semialdehyde dehydrogenase/glutarate-semialdehyde dehydrogenase